MKYHLHNRIGEFADSPLPGRMGFTSGIFATGKVKDSQGLALCSFLVCRAISDFLLLLAGYHGFFD
jgi:hypothetical protein